MGAVQPAIQPVSDAKPPASPLPQQPSLRQRFPPADAMAVPAVADGHLAGSESRNCKIRSRRPADLSSGSPVPARHSQQYAVSRHAITCLALKPMRLGSGPPRVPHGEVMIRLWSMSARKPYPPDGSDEEWALVGSCLTLSPQDAGQRELREVFCGLRFLVKTGAPGDGCRTSCRPGQWFIGRHSVGWQRAASRICRGAQHGLAFGREAQRSTERCCAGGSGPTFLHPKVGSDPGMMAPGARRLPTCIWPWIRRASCRRCTLRLPTRMTRPRLAAWRRQCRPPPAKRCVWPVSAMAAAADKPPTLPRLMVSNWGS